MFAGLQAKLILAVIGMLVSIGIGWALCNKIVVTPLRAENQSLEETISKQTSTIQALQDQRAMVEIVANKKAANYQQSIARMKAICSRPQVQLHIPEGGTSEIPTLISGSTIDMLNGMFARR